LFLDFLNTVIAAASLGGGYAGRLPIGANADAVEAIVNDIATMIV